MAESHEFGKRAEQYAAEFLVAKGYAIVERNWKFGKKELDIICTNGKMLVVVEVKARTRSIFPFPEDVLSRQKEQFILDASEEYLYRNKVGLPIRFDLIAIVSRNGLYDIEHIEDAIIPEAG